MSLLLLSPRTLNAIRIITSPISQEIWTQAAMNSQIHALSPITNAAVLNVRWKQALPLILIVVIYTDGYPFVLEGKSFSMDHLRVTEGRVRSCLACR